MACQTASPAYQFLFLQLLLFFSRSTATICSHDQTSALLQFKQHFSFMNPSSYFDCEDLAQYSEIVGVESAPYCDGRCPSYPKTLSWKEDIDCCSWDGVTCDTLTGHVIGLDLSCGWLHGNIPSNTTLFLLRHLQSLNLAFNDFSLSHISSDFSRLSSLTHLNLSNSNFAGKIPSEISHLSKLVSLDLSTFDYSFELDLGFQENFNMIIEKPDFDGLVQNLTELTELFLDTVDMSTIIPRSLSNLSSSLTSLSLNDCGLQGNFPDHIFRLPNLQMLSLRGNFNLRGNFPNVNWSSPLKSLDASDMSFSGKLPNSIANLMSLRHLRLHNCSLVGSIPTSLGNLTQLTYLRLSYNDFSGQLPLFLSKLAQLRLLDLSNNNFIGEFPDIFANLTQLSHVDFSSNQLAGSIPSQISSLQNLCFISFFNNSLNGTIPSWLFTLPLLKFVDLGHNQFTGHIGEFRSKSLQIIYLGNNRLNGSIPSSLFELVNLIALDVSSNNLSGTELYMFAKLKKLEMLDLSHINLSLSTTFEVNSTFPQLQSLSLSACNISEFPGTLRGLDQLSSLDLSYNKIHEFPSILRGLDQLSSLDLSYNKIHEFPSFLRGLDQLSFLDLSYNKIHEFPGILRGLDQLSNLDLSHNNIHEFPGILRGLDQLSYLDLSDNKIHGRIPNWLWDIGKDTLMYLNLSHNYLTSIEQLPWTNLQFLDLQSNLLQGALPIPPPSLIFFSLSNNSLTGKIPHSICNMSTIIVIDLSTNNLRGTIPECMGNFNSLHVLDLRNNKFYGTIPETFAKGNHLRTLNLNGNGLKGPIPRSLVNCTKLEVLDLGKNKINDTFPYWLGKLPELQVLVLHSNKFYSYIQGCLEINHCFSKLKIFDLSDNKFSGLLPATYFKNLNAMVDVDEAERKLQYVGEFYYQDSVRVTLKGFEFELLKIITTFTTIDFSNNNFHGEIPEVIGKLHALRLLNLSHNNLISCIPSSLGNLVALESLDLSSNKLVGEIPWQLTSLNFLGVLNLSHNRLTGPIPRNNHFDTFPNTSYDKNLGLCGFPLSNECSNDERPQQPSVIKEDAESTNGFGWKVVLMGYGCGMVFGVVMGYLVFSTGKPQWLVRIVEGGHSRKGKRSNNRRERRIA